MLRWAIYLLALGASAALLTSAYLRGDGQTFGKLLGASIVAGTLAAVKGKGDS